MDNHRIEELPEWAQERFKAEKDRADREEAEKKVLQAQADPTSFLQYLYNLHTTTKVLRVETDRKRVAAGNAAKVDGKVYPRVLLPWTHFRELHNRRFRDLRSHFDKLRIFPSFNDVSSEANYLSPQTRKDEQDIRPFIRTTMEWPAMKIVDAYLKTTPDPRYADLKFCFGNGVYGLTDTVDNWFSRIGEPPPKKRSIDRSSTIAPDRWGLRVTIGTTRTPEAILPGEYKAAHKAQGERIRNVLAGTSPPAEFLIDDCAKIVQARYEKKIASATSAGEADQSSTTPQELLQPPLNSDQQMVSQILCQAYHYMVANGLLYGYISSGECSVFLSIPAADHHVLLYHVVNLNPWAGDELLPESLPDRVRILPPAQMSTLVLLALQEEAQSGQWVDTALRDLPRWPEIKKTETQTICGPLQPPPRDDTDHGDNNDDHTPPQHGATPLTLPSQSTKRRRESTAGPSGSWDSQRTERPCAEYCTQACLLGLVRHRPLDPACPNASLHVQPGNTSQLHAITNVELCELVRNQLAQNMDNGLQPLAKFGLFGATGILFKITLLGYGYTLVAKGVQARKVDAIVHEANIYAHCKQLQGVLIPVFLGNIDLARPYRIATFAAVEHMMLMSWAGVSLENHEPEDVDIDDAISEMRAALHSYGIRNGDVREANLVWNEEQGRVMAVDFDLALVEEQKGAEVVGQETKKRTHPEVEPIGVTTPGKRRKEIGVV